MSERKNSSWITQRFKMVLKTRNNQSNVKQLSRRLSSRCSCFNPFSSSDTNAFICFMSIPWRFCRRKNRPKLKVPAESSTLVPANIYLHHMQSGGSWLSDWGAQRRWKNAHFGFHWTPARKKSLNGCLGSNQDSEDHSALTSALPYPENSAWL